MCWPWWCGGEEYTCDGGEEGGEGGKAEEGASFGVVREEPADWGGGDSKDAKEGLSPLVGDGERE